MEKKLIEIVRSFSYKLNCGNYESRDFFCSQKVECFESEAEEKSKALYEFVKNEVIKSVNDYKKEMLKELPKKKFEDIADSIKAKPVLTVEEWENLTPEEQQARQEVKKADGRIEYSERKELKLCKICGGTGSDINPLIGRYHEKCKINEQYKLKD